MVTLVSTTCSETLETEHRLCKDTDLCLAEERGPSPGRQQEKAALNCSRNLPWLGDKRHSHKGANAAGRGSELSQSCAVGQRGRGIWDGEPKATSVLPAREDERPQWVPGAKCNCLDSLTALWLGA